MDKVRVDKWMWSVRIFKSRTKATDACKGRRVFIGESPLKASSQIQVGQVLTIRKGGFQLEFKVKELINKRVSATLAEPCYENITSEEELNKFSSWFIGKGKPEVREKGTGRPTKRDRRELTEYKEGAYIEKWLDDDF